jgi:hypothetical protein
MFQATTTLLLHTLKLLPWRPPQLSLIPTFKKIDNA